MEKNTRIRKSIRCVSYKERLTGLKLFWLEKKQPKGDVKKI